MGTAPLTPKVSDDMKTFIWSRGEFFIWLTGAALAFALIMVAALLSVVLYNGFGFFWPFFCF